MTPVTEPASWVRVPPGSGFGLACLPWGVVEDGGRRHPVVRVGDHVLLLDLAHRAGLFDHVDGASAEVLAADSLDPLMAAGPRTWHAVRNRAGEVLATGSRLAADRVLRERLVRPLRGRVHPVMPFTVADYVDFYCSLHHATNLGRILRPDDDPLPPNWRHLPIGYHGRAGTVRVSGTSVQRPDGLRPGDHDTPTFGPTRRLDLELEVGIVVGAGSTPGTPVRPDEVDQHVFGFCLLNDWSARDIQAYEYRPLGPFLGKSFHTSVSPWIVPMDAVRPALTFPPPQDPVPAPHLQAMRPWALPIRLEVALQTAAMREAGAPAATIATTDFADMYWTVAQMVAHATSNGAHLRTGDLFASGTVSGPAPGTYGSLVELSWGGRDPLVLPDGSTRTFLEDGDTVVLRGATDRPDGSTVGWGEVVGTVAPARSSVV